MGSPCEIKVYCTDDSKAQHVANLVIADVKRIEQRYSRYLEDSVLSQINRVAEQGGVIDIDEETAALLNYADTCYRQSGGLFDITSGILRKVWDFHSQCIPQPADIKKLLKSIGWQKLKFDQHSVSFAVPGMQLDFGGIGKEYAVDRAATICLQQGIRHGMVNLGGDIKIIGPHPDGQPWSVGIRHPLKAGQLLAQLPVYRGGVASSGDYERCIKFRGKRYGHILNPKTGWPVSGISGVTVVADQCVIAGSVCTITMLKGKQGKKWIEQVGLNYVLVDEKGKVSSNLIQT